MADCGCGLGSQCHKTRCSQYWHSQDNACILPSGHKGLHHFPKGTYQPGREEKSVYTTCLGADAWCVLRLNGHSYEIYCIMDPEMAPGEQQYEAEKIAKALNYGA